MCECNVVHSGMYFRSDSTIPIANVNLKRRIKIVCVLAFDTLMATSVCFTSLVTQFFICPSGRWKSSFYVFTYALMLQMAAISLILLQMLFTFRSIDAFNDSLLELSKRLKYIFYGLSLIEIISYITIMLVFRDFTLSDYGWAR